MTNGKSNPTQQNDVLQYGYDAVQKPIDAVLNYSGTPTPMSSGSGSLVVLVAGGFKRYANEEEEKQDLDQDKEWKGPNTVDFEATAYQTSGIGNNYTPVSNEAQFVGTLQRAGNISRIVYIGHGSSSGLSLGGGSFDKYSLQNPQYSKIFEAIKNNKPSSIDLISCFGGISSDFTKLLAKTFGCNVRGYKGRVHWRATLNDSHTKIIREISSDGENWQKGFSGMTGDSTIPPS